MNIGKNCRDNLLALADAYSKATGKSISSISREAYGNALLFTELRKNSKKTPPLTLRKLENLVSWFDANWPPNAERPLLMPLRMDLPQD